MTKELLILGAGNVGGYLAYNIEEFGGYDILGFLDDDQAKWNNQCYGISVLGGIDLISNYSSRKDLCVVVAISNPLARMSVVNRLRHLDINFPSFVAKNVWISKSVKLGRGIVLYPGVSVNYETAIGDFVVMNMNCAIGHNCIIEAGSTLAPGVNFAGFTYVEEGAEIGIGVSTRQSVRIGSYSIIGGQSMLLRDVPSKSVIVGVPGRELR